MEKENTKQILAMVLHPVRMRIIMTLAGSAGMTSLQLAESLADVPQATLYRHIKQLATAGILSVKEERPVRGTVEKVYQLDLTRESLVDVDAFSQMDKKDHMVYFTRFTSSLLDDFARYLDHADQPDFAKDGVGYQKTPLFISDAEMPAFANAINLAFQPYIAMMDQPDRKKRYFTTIFMPEITGQMKEGEK